MHPVQNLSVDQIDLSDIEFWARPLDEREGAFLTLREQRPLAFFKEPEVDVPGITDGPGYYAVTKHADILADDRTAAHVPSGRNAELTRPREDTMAERMFRNFVNGGHAMGFISTSS